MIDPALFGRTLAWEDALAFATASVEFFASDEPGAAAHALQVIAVTERPPMTGGRQFTILFRGPHAPLLAQGTYRVRHASLGDFAIFITPIGQTAQASDYEACFAHVA